MFPLSFSASASKWHVHFFSSKILKWVGIRWLLPIYLFCSYHVKYSQVKEYIRCAKAWRNKKWPTSQGDSGRPKSFFISLLVLRAHEGTLPNSYNIQTVTCNIALSICICFQPFSIYWEEKYSVAAYRRLASPKLHIVDPANPSNNLYETGITWSYQRNEQSHDCERGDGDWMELVHQWSYKNSRGDTSILILVTCMLSIKLWRCILEIKKLSWSTYNHNLL